MSLVSLSPRCFYTILHFFFQCSSLLDSNLYDDFIDDLKEDYDIIREEHYESLHDRKYVSLDEARKKKFQIDWNQSSKPGTVFVNIHILYCRCSKSHYIG